MDTSSRQAVAAIVRRRDEILLVRDGDDRWALPGGVVEPDELMDVALRREVLEETGLTVDGPQRLLYVTQHRHAELGVFTALIFELSADGAIDAVEARWFSVAEAVEALDEQPFRPMRDPVVAYLRGPSTAPSVWLYADTEADPTVISTSA